MTNLIEFDITQKVKARPVKQKSRPLNPSQLESLQNHIETWKREGVIEEAISPWASALVPVRKSEGKPGEILNKWQRKLV